MTPGSDQVDDTPTVEVLIVAYGNGDSLLRCVRSTAAIGPHVAVAIHDNSPTDVALQLALEEASRLGLQARGEHCPENCGFARGVNALVGGSSSDYLLLLNPDAEILTWGGVARASPKTLVAPVVYDADGHLSVTWGGRPTPLAEVARRWPAIGHLTLVLLKRRRQLRVAPHWVSGVAMLMRRDLFVEMGGLDEHFFMYYEDVDFCERLRARGGGIVLDDQWTIRHLGGESSAGRPADVLIRSYDSGRYFFEKHRRSTFGYDRAWQGDTLIRLAAARLTRRSGGSDAYRILRRHIWDRRQSGSRDRDSVGRDDVLP